MSDSGMVTIALNTATDADAASFLDDLALLEVAFQPLLDAMAAAKSNLGCQ